VCLSSKLERMGPVWAGVFLEGDQLKDKKLLSIVSESRLAPGGQLAV